MHVSLVGYIGSIGYLFEDEDHLELHFYLSSVFGRGRVAIMLYLYHSYLGIMHSYLAQNPDPDR